MKIVPVNSILIAGNHCEAGVALEVADTLGRILIAERQATLAPAAQAEAPAPEVEAAAVAPAVETAAVKKSVSRKSVSP